MELGARAGGGTETAAWAARGGEREGERRDRRETAARAARGGE